MKQIVLFLVTAFLLLGCAEKKETSATIAPEELPNIVWLVAEDQSPDFFPMYGDSTISLPNLEALAGDGVVFTNAYAPVPVCAPTRSGIITGMYPTTLGTHNMRTYSPGSPENRPQIGIPSYSPIVPKGTVMFPQLLRKKGYYTTNNSKEDYNFKKLQSAWDESSDKAHWRNRPEDAPFFAIFNFAVCHESGIWKQGDNELFVSPDSVPVPPYFPDNNIIRHDLAVNYSNLKRMDTQAGEIIAQLKEDGLYDNTIIFFYADHGGPFPRHKRALYETGTKVPLIIKFRGNEQRGTRNSDFVNFIDFAPTLLSWAGVKPPEVMQGKALYGKYGDNVKRNYIFTTSDRFDGLYDRLRAVRSQRYKYIKNFNTDIGNALPVVYREQMPMMQELKGMWKKGELNKAQSLWFRTPKPAEELYDLQNDPQELNNLAERPELQDTLKHLRGVLKKWMVTSHDLGEYPEKELLAKWLPNGEQPRLSHLEKEKKVNGIALYAHRPDATILWKHPKDSLWRMYMEPLPATSSFIAKAERIGFKDSEILEYKVD